MLKLETDRDGFWTYVSLSVAMVLVVALEV